MITTLAGGCFWCTEAVFKRLKGVEKITPGYSGGQVENPTYEQVSSGLSGHAEVVQVEFDPEVISYRQILEVFFALHDPTTLNRQGNDVGTQYRSVVFYHSPEQKAATEKYIQELKTKGVYKDPVVTEVSEFIKFYPAEQEHLDFYDRNRQYGYCRVIIDPKIQKLFKDFKTLVKE
jgi:peptide-methionine (S)-S-oxide reductase